MSVQIEEDSEEESQNDKGKTQIQATAKDAPTLPVPNITSFLKEANKKAAVLNYGSLKREEKTTLTFSSVSKQFSRLRKPRSQER